LDRVDLGARVGGSGRRRHARDRSDRDGDDRKEPRLRPAQPAEAIERPEEPGTEHWVTLVSSFSGANQAPGRAAAKWFLFFGLPRATNRSTAEFRRSRIDACDSFCNVAAALLISACLGLVSCAGMGGPAPSSPAPPPETPHDKVVRLATEIRRAAYADDGERLKALVEEMAPFTEAAAESPLVSRARYWRGFAFWRSAWNGMLAA